MGKKIQLVKKIDSKTKKGSLTMDGKIEIASVGEFVLLRKIQELEDRIETLETK